MWEIAISSRDYFKAKKVNLGIILNKCQCLASRTHMYDIYSIMYGLYFPVLFVIICCFQVSGIFGVGFIILES